ncbi:hypothetical protein HBH98_137710 [Parastagonospora nodorum]|nr:hypothetical protein HBH98_137710 [Parastagonospora nodorum]KAH4393915.1 hypothetical protein HBH97_035240 [Parastagonospora nodorum]KAH4423710.1 hypothetical protein HBH99_046940 [Parastagonospora nodorum]
MRLKKNVLGARLRIIEIKNYAKRNSTIFITRDYTIIKLIRLSNFYIKCICTADARRIVRGLENSASASLLVYSDYALQECSLLTLIGIVLYNAIKEYYDDRMRKIIYFYSYTIEEDYNCAGKREDNILTVDKCRTGHSNKEDIEANEREEETKVQLRKLLGEIHDILLREFCRANNFIESVIHNDDEQDEFAILAEEYTIDNCIIYALLEDCDALVERYKEEINCSNLYSTV